MTKYITKLLTRLQQTTIPAEKKKLRMRLRAEGHTGGLRNISVAIATPSPKTKLLSPAKVEKIKFHNNCVNRKVAGEKQNCDLAVVYRHDLMANNPIVDMAGKIFYHTRDLCFNGKRVLVLSKHQAEYVKQKGGISIYENPS